MTNNPKFINIYGKTINMSKVWSVSICRLANIPRGRRDKACLKFRFGPGNDSVFRTETDRIGRVEALMREINDCLCNWVNMDDDKFTKYIKKRG